MAIAYYYLFEGEILFIFFPNITNLLKYQVSYLIQQNVSVATNERWLLS